MAAGTATGIVIYTGSETRSVMNNSQPRSKVGLLDMEINGLTKVFITSLYQFIFYEIIIHEFLLLVGFILCSIGFGFGDDDSERI